MSFVNRLTVTLTLDIGGKRRTVPGGDIKSLSLKLHPWGFEAECVFWLVSQAKESEDTLYAPFISDRRIDVTLKVDRTFDTVGEAAEPIEVVGIVEERELMERAFSELSGEPVLHRRYTIRFRDPAAVLWSRHRPVTLLTDSTHAKLIAQETPPDLKVACEWKRSKTEHPILALGLGADAGGATFRDFVFWLAEREGFGVHYDVDKRKYAFEDGKPKGKVEPLVVDDVEQVDVIFDPPPRHTVCVLNGAAEAQSKTKKVSNSRGYAGVRQDRLLVSPIAQKLDAAATEARTQLVTPPARLRVDFARYPSTTIRALRLYDFSDGFSPRVYEAKKKYRLLHFEIRAHAERQAATDDSGDPTNSYELDVVAELEDSSDLRKSYPWYRPVVYPFEVEGKVVSDQGVKTEGTYQAYSDNATKLEHHYVSVPLWGKKVRVPYQPNLLQGHFYFPPYKDERVQLALYFDEAFIVRYLDWRPGARLPKESQGNHILLGKKADDQTSIRHVFESSKPVLTVERTSAKDLQTIVVSEGTILLETKEKKS